MSPAEEYARRLQDRAQRVAHFEKIHARLGNFRLILALVAGVEVWLIFHSDISPWWLTAPVVIFAAIAVYHSRILREQELAKRAVTVYSNGLARIEDRWHDIGSIGECFNNPHHVYASDLDLFGKGGLFQLLSTARTGMGEDTLANWLLAPSSAQQIRERHACIEELRTQLDLREDLSVLGGNTKVGVNAAELVKWAEAPSRIRPLWVRWIALGLAALLACAIAVWQVWGLLAPAIALLLAEAIVKYRMRNVLEEVQHGAEHALRDLDLLAEVLARIEAHEFQSPRLLALQQYLSSSHVASSRAIAKLRFIVDLILSQHNPIFQLLDIPSMYSVQVAFAVETWRKAHGPALPSWLAAVGEIEAILSLAGYSYEHAADPFPEFVEGDACFDSDELGHPLLPAAVCTRNNVSICGATRVLLVSGSNMSGKSTLMRAIGINIVLAMAGAPVRAAHLRLTPLHVGASIRVNDSLQEGSSRFYAEIMRLKQVFDLAGHIPSLLFLLDELLQGTNSKDRRIGAEGILRALLQRGAIGLISTHDLALTEIGEPLDQHIKNVHFQDELENGRMKFDYKLRKGLVTKSNGLELMRSVGLNV